MKTYSFLAEFCLNHLVHSSIKSSISRENREKLKEKYNQYKKNRAEKRKEEDNDNETDENRPVNPKKDQQDDDIDNENPFLSDD